MPRSKALPAPERDRDPAADRRTRALEEPLDVIPRPDTRFLRLEVRNPARGTRYTVVLPAFPDRDGGFCTCTDFARRGLGTCKHLEAAWIWTQEHPAEALAPRPSAPVGRGWPEVDRRLRALRFPLTPRTLRQPGSALLGG
jgi:hypothetical protein